MSDNQGEDRVDATSAVEATTADVALARDRLLGNGSGRSKLPAPVLREALADLYEFWLTVHAGQSGVDGRAGVALLAVGGLGRRELVPYSDLDLVLVHDGRSDVREIAERLWYPLWNSGVGLDHSVRTVGEALQVARTDLRTAMGLLDARHVAGDATVTERLATSARAQWRTGVRDRVDDLVESAWQRWRRAGEVAHWVQPDLKHGRGGLRDLAIVQALALAQLVDRPADDVTQAHALLLDARTELRRLAGRARDVLRPQDGDEVAAALGMTDRFVLARALSGAGRAVGYAVDVAFRAARPATGRRVLGVLRRGPERRGLADGVVLHGAEVALARDVSPERDPALLLRVAAVAARGKHPIAQGTLSRLADSAPEPRSPWPASARQELISLLGAGDGLVDIVEALDRTGLWARLFPEWGAVRDLPPRDAAHMWTVDRHLVQATAHAAGLVTSVSRPDLLLVGTLLHDIGKGRDADHSEVGAKLARQVAGRLGLSTSDVETVSAMVRHHLLLPHTATRRDVTDEATVSRVAETLNGDPVLLELLAALTEADSRATGPGVWTDWKATLVAELVAACRTAMAGKRPPGPDPLDDKQRARAETVAASGKPDIVLEPESTPGTSLATVTAMAIDRPGLLSRAAGVLALNSLEVHAATVWTHGSVGVQQFHVSPRFGSLPDATLLREQFTRAVTGSLPLGEKLAAKERDYAGVAQDGPPPKVLWFDGEAGSGDVVLELRAADRIGLLHRVAEALEAAGVGVHWARVSTVGATVVDSFALVSATSGDLGWRQKIERAVLMAVG
ncbi:UTP--GlnB (protein PII) uridylyltransferase GlnD [Herbihabitans rhizosphaerae]|uniref:Bifunctional uridylyltransferase/uridylyl-removing enzyme n=1 Tax=Herbihabitans rhizosphaerae TaxID=1872711 RepID=A0A4Q7KIB6_9PSEU|nr:[protein-PII] uridylyltransferase [Herbihabitans rhizosphaerae]RZS34658.1 UTP--GlnB (protein PII) uridylyltransferase GlnD [Herbihabitans rhizosphaerae]